MNYFVYVVLMRCLNLLLGVAIGLVIMWILDGDEGDDADNGSE